MEVISNEMILMDLSHSPNIKLTEDIVKRSVQNFINKPIVVNVGQKLQDYRDGIGVSDFYKHNTVGVIMTAKFEDGKVKGKVDWFDCNYIRMKYDNWCITLSDDKTYFDVNGIEIF